MKLNRVLLKEIAEVQTGPFGSQLHQSDYVKFGTPMITVEHLIDGQIVGENAPRVSDEDKKRLSKYVLSEGDIVFSRVGSVDRSAFVSKNEHGWMFSGRLLRVRVNSSGVSPNYLAWYFANPSFKELVKRIAVGATMPSINTKILENIEVLYPDRLVQEKICRVLDPIQKKIEINTKLNEYLEAMARAIFKEWFIDFGPVRAKAEGRRPFGVDDITAALFPDSFEESELGMIPKGWRVNSISESCDLLMGQSPPGNTYNEAGVGIVFFQGRAEFGSRFPKPRLFCSAPSRVVKSGTIILSVRAPVGDINVSTNIETCIGRGLAGVLHRQGGTSYTYYLLQSLKDKFDMYNSEGTVFGSINKDTLSAIKYIEPSTAILDRFVRMIKPLDELYLSNFNETNGLIETRDLILPRLISGELDVGDIE